MVGGATNCELNKAYDMIGEGEEVDNSRKVTTMAEKDDDELMSWDDLGKLLDRLEAENPEAAGAYFLMPCPAWDLTKKPGGSERGSAGRIGKSGSQGKGQQTIFA
jgi:hypothetical protein